MAFALTLSDPTDLDGLRRFLTSGKSAIYRANLKALVPKRDLAERSVARAHEQECAACGAEKMP